MIVASARIPTAISPTWVDYRQSRLARRFQQFPGRVPGRLDPGTQGRAFGQVGLHEIDDQQRGMAPRLQSRAKATPGIIFLQRCRHRILDSSVLPRRWLTGCRRCDIVT